MSDALLSINVQNTSNRDIASHGVTYGVPFAQGALSDTKKLAARLESGKLRPLQTRVLETWPDDSIKWLLLDFDLPVPKNKTQRVDLVKASVRSSEKIVEVTEDARKIVITTPRLAVTLNKKSFSLFDSYKIDGKEMVDAGSDIVIEEPRGKRYYASNAASEKLSVKVVEAGAQRVVVESSGRHTAGDGSELFGFRVRYTFRPSDPGVKVSYKFTNTEPPEQGVRVASIKLVVPTKLGRKSVHHLRQQNTGRHWFSTFRDVPENVEILAAGAVNEAAKNRYGSASEGTVVIRDLSSFREDLGKYPYFLRPGNARTDMTGGLRRTYPYIAMTSEKASAVGFFFDMGFNYPKAVAADRGVLSFDIWPAFAGELLWRRGMSKEHDLYLAFFDEQLDAKTLEGVYFDREIVGDQPVHLTIDADYVRACEVVELHRWLPYDDTRYLAVETKLGSAGGAGSTAYTPSSRGMMDVGDHISGDRSWAHNNENDAILGGITEYYRMAAPGRLRGALDKARHNAHIDLIAFDPDPLRQGTMPAHCPEHTDGSTYPSHMWADGLIAAYCISGNEDFKDAALSVGENMLRWQKDDPTIFYADSRECGWPALAYCRLYQFTHDPKWLDAIHEVFEHMRSKVNDDAVILYELPHGVGTQLTSYGEFVAWRALFFYYELTGKDEVKQFLIKCLRKVYKLRAGHMVGGWACNDMFPAWALYKLTGEKKVLEDNYPFLRFLLERKEGFPWGGVDMHYYLAELHHLGELDKIVKSV